MRRVYGTEYRKALWHRMKTGRSAGKRRIGGNSALHVTKTGLVVPSRLAIPHDWSHEICVMPSRILGYLQRILCDGTLARTLHCMSRIDMDLTAIINAYRGPLIGLIVSWGVPGRTRLKSPRIVFPRPG